MTCCVQVTHVLLNSSKVQKQILKETQYYSRVGEGNGTPLQYSCLENPRDRGAWWAAIYGVAQSRTQLKRLSSSGSIQGFCTICNFRHPLGLLECTVSPAEKREGSTILGLNRSEKGKNLKEHSSFWIIWIQRKRIQTDFEGKVIEGNIEGTLTLIAFTGFIQNGIMKMKASKEFFIFFTHLRITAAKAHNSRIFIHIK